MTDLRTLHEAATPAPWYSAGVDADLEGVAIHAVDPKQQSEDDPSGETYVATVYFGMDSGLIVALRNAYAAGELVERADLPLCASLGYCMGGVMVNRDQTDQLAAIRTALNAAPDADLVGLVEGLVRAATKGCDKCEYDGEQDYPRHELCTEEAGCGFADLRQMLDAAAEQATKEVR